MPANRLETLRNLVDQNPADSRTRYMFAMELANSGQLEQAATEYRKIIETESGYVAAYFHGGQALERIGKIEEAKEMYRAGIAACDRVGDAHTRAEIEEVLDALQN